MTLQEALYAGKLGYIKYMINVLLCVKLFDYVNNLKIYRLPTWVTKFHFHLWQT